VRSRTDNGKRLVELMWRIARGGKFRLSRTTIDGQVVEVRVRPSIRDRSEAAAWLSDRGWGKVKDVIKVEGDEAERRPTIIFMQGRPGEDPLAEPEPALPMKPLPAPPTSQMPEISFEMEDDLELPPPGDPR
jgi:hypothetical protein